jgi:hypothetical protein
MTNSRTLAGHTIGGVVGAVLGGPAGAILGSIGGGTAAALLPGIIGNVVGELAAIAIASGAGQLGHLISEADQQQINHDLQTAFRDAFLEAIHDLGGPYCFPHQPQPVSGAGAAFFSTPQGNKLWRTEDPRAKQVCEVLRQLGQAVQRDTVLPVQPHSEAESVHTYLLVELPVSRDVRDPFMKEVVSPCLPHTVVQDIPDFVEHLHDNLLDRTLLHLGELLKQRTNAWRAFERAVDRVLFAELRLRGIEHEEILARLDKIQKHLEQMEYGNSRSASQGLIALAELMHKDKVREAVIAFRTDFEATCQQIELLSHYKDLHDLLHTLQFSCYNLIVEDAKRFPKDEAVAYNLEEHDLKLEELIWKLQAARDRALLPTTETRWIQDVVKAREALKEATAELSARQIKRAVWLLNRVLAIQPAQINTRLNAAARTLRLSALVETLDRVRQNLAVLELDAEKMEQLRVGVDALVRVDENLTTSVENHDWWQSIDLELRRIEANLGRDLSELEMSWPDLEVIVEPVYRDNNAEWASSLKEVSDGLSEAIAIRNPSRTRRFFRRYRRQVCIRFFSVDADLKRQCEELRLVGAPLSLVMRMTA